MAGVSIHPIVRGARDTRNSEDEVNVTGTSLGSKRESSSNRGEIRSSAEHQRGFTMIELLIAVAIMMVLAAIAVPKVMNAVYLSRIRSAADNLSALLQQARVAAEQNNATVPVYITNVGPSNVPGAFISCSAANCPDGAAWAVNDPYVPYSGSVRNSANPPAALSQASLGFTAQPAGTTPVYFTSLGMISNLPAGTFTAKGFVFYLKDNEGDCAAVSLSPTGRSKVWLYTAGSWH